MLSRWRRRCYYVKILRQITLIYCRVIDITRYYDIDDITR